RWKLRAEAPYVSVPESQTTASGATTRIKLYQVTHSCIKTLHMSDTSFRIPRIHVDSGRNPFHHQPVELFRECWHIGVLGQINNRDGKRITSPDILHTTVNEDI